MTKNKYVLNWIDEMAAMTKPDKDNAEDEAQKSARQRPVNGGTDDDGGKGKGNRKRPKLNHRADQL